MPRIFALLAIVSALSLSGYFVWQKVQNKSDSQKIVLVGILVRGKSYLPSVESFKAKMEEYGYSEGKNIRYITQLVDQQQDLAPAVDEFLKAHVDLIHTYSTPATKAAAAASKSIPIIFGSMGDPLASGLVDSLTMPGHNVTGINSLSVDLTAKRLQLLVELFPAAKRFAMIVTRGDIPGERSIQVAMDSAAKLGVSIQVYYIEPGANIQDVISSVHKKDVDGIVLSADSATWAKLPQIIAQSNAEKLPLSVFDKDMVGEGGLVGYGPDYKIMGEQAATLAYKVLQGANPANLPIETPTRFILAVNLKTAEANGFHVPDTFLSQADLVIR